MKNLAMAAVATLSVVQAFGQTPESNQFSVRLGAVFPTDRLAKTAAKTWVAVGAQYTFKYGEVSSDGRSVDYAASLDYYGRSNFRAVPILVNRIGNLSPKMWWTVGAGVSLSRFASGAGTDSSVNFAYTAGIAYTVIEGPQPIFVEGRFWGNQESKLNAFGLYAGIKF